MYHDPFIAALSCISIWAWKVFLSVSSLYGVAGLSGWRSWAGMASRCWASSRSTTPWLDHWCLPSRSGVQRIHRNTYHQPTSRPGDRRPTFAASDEDDVRGSREKQPGAVDEEAGLLLGLQVRGLMLGGALWWLRYSTEDVYSARGDFSTAASTGEVLRICARTFF